jgi:hypothetical protein
VPELLLVTTNPDQIDDGLAGLLLLLECMRNKGALDQMDLVFPYILFVTNGDISTGCGIASSKALSGP